MEMAKKKSQETYPNHYENLITTTLLDANLLHDIVTGKSVTVVLHFVNTTQTDWFSKRQATWRLEHMVQSLLLPKLQQNKLWTLETH